MTDLARRKVTPENRRPSEHESGTDTVLNLDEHKIAVSAPERVLGQCRNVGVIRDGHRSLARRGHELLKREPSPPEARRSNDDAVEIDASGGSNPDSEKRRRCSSNERLGQFDNLVRCVITGAPVARD